jgi:hypothetical protein
VTVFDFEDVLLAPNGKIYTIYWHEDGDQPSLAIEACVNNTYDLAATTVRNGTDHNLTVANSHVIDGYVLRDPFITFEVSGESLNGSLVWNADTSDVKDHLEQNGQHYVNVTREVIGQYGSVEYLVWFVYNEGQTPPGTGDVSDLRVIQRNLDSGENNTVVVTEVQKGTTGLSGTFTVDMNSPLGQRTVQFNETEDRLERKLEEMTTIGNVEVRRYMYPSSTSGGWGKQQSTDDTYGGYEWRVRFLENPGSTNGLTFPPGSGDVDGISTTYSSSLNGNSAKTETYMVDGSNPITGEFKLKYEGDEMNDYSNSYAMNVEMETLLEDLDTIGDVTINRRQVIMEQIPGVTAKVYRDGHYVELVYDSDTFEHVDLLNYMAPGDLIRIGGGNAYDVVNNSDSYSYTGASFLDIVQVNSGSPLFKTTEDLAMTPHILPNQSIEVADTTYQITKTGVEVQQVVVMCDISSCNASTLSLSFLHDMVEESTSCLPFTMSASDLKDALEGFSTIDSGDIIVTKESIDEYVSVFKIYFHGSSVFGNVDLIATSSSVHSTCVGSDNMTILSHTIVQGGYTEVQTMHQALDSGSLRTATDDDTCIAWQSSAQTLESLFNSLSAYTDEALPFDGVANDTLIETAIDYPSLFVKVGDTLRFTDSEGGSATAAVTLISQSYVTVDATVRLNGTLSVSIVHEDAVRVRKSGFNNPKQHILSLRVTSDAIIEDDTASSTHYRLRMTDQEDGTQADSSCLPYHATEDDMLASLNELAMSLDLNRDGLQNDDGHFLVSRLGDGSYAWGFGYQFTITYTGDQFDGGRTAVLGGKVPVLSIVDEGLNGCTDVTGGDSIITIETIQEGVSSHVYDVYFVGGHLENVDMNTLSLCDTYSREEGMVHSVEWFTTQEGGSFDVQELRLASVSPMAERDSDGSFTYDLIDTDNSTNAGYFKLLLGSDIISPSDNETRCFDWSEELTASIVDSRLEEAIASYLSLNGTSDQVQVTRTGLMAYEDDYGYSYRITFDGDYVRGSVASLQVLLDGDSITTFSDVTSSVAIDEYDDITFYGSIDSTDIVNMTFTVVIDSNRSTYDSVNYTVVKMNYSSTTDAYSRSIETGTVSVTEANSAVATIDGISFSFNSTSGHYEGDTWYVEIENTVIQCQTLPSNATVTIETAASSKEAVYELASSQKYVGDYLDATTKAYLVPGLYSILEHQVQVQQLVISDTSSDGVWNEGHPFYQIYSADANSTTECLAWNASDADVEDALNSIISCDSSDIACILVVRYEDAVNAPNGFIYNIYFEGDGLYDASLLEVLTTTSNCSSTFDASGKEFVNVSVLTTGDDRTRFTSTILPLGSYEDSTDKDRWYGSNDEGYPVYRVNGIGWDVNFETNLGNLRAIEASSTALLSSGSSIQIIDDITQGVHPTYVELNNLLTGIAYDVSVQSHTSKGFSSLDGNSASSYAAIPATVPPSMDDITTAIALHVDEVQEVIIATKHIAEVQTIQTTAQPINEIQEITTYADEGTTITGNFSLKFPEIQMVKSYSSSPITSGGFRLHAFGYDAASFDGGYLNTTDAFTSCLDYDATSDEVESALEALSFIDDVSVKRSGSASASSDYGYTYAVSFVGTLVAGDMPEMRATSCASGGLVSATNDANATVYTYNEGEAYGTDSEIQQLTIEASAVIHRGQYTLSFYYAGGEYTTSCIEWDASAIELENALESLPNIDAVAITRLGDALQEWSYGYQYSIIFTGNALHTRPSVGNNPPLMTVDMFNETCEAFGTFVNGELLPFNTTSLLNASVSVDSIHDAGIDLPTTSVSADTIKDRLELLPLSSSIAMSVVSLADEEGGRTWTLSFDKDLGDVPSLACSVSDDFPSAYGGCMVETVMDGNQLGGLWYVETSSFLAHDVSASDLEAVLETMEGILDVMVTRSEADGQRGYTWTITFLENEGDVDMLRVSSSLTGANAVIQVEEVVKGNYLGGTFQLSYEGYATDSLSYDASSSAVKNALEAIDVMGYVDVTASNADRDGGRTYTVTFRSLPGDVSMLEIDTQGLEGESASALVLEKTKGSEALGSSISVSFDMPYGCSASQVTLGSSGSPIDKIVLELDTVSSFSSVDQSIIYEPSLTIQKIRIASPTLRDLADEESPFVSGFFSLLYEEEETPIISSVASAYDVKQAIESLSSIDTVTVARDWSYEPLEGCTVNANELDLYVTVSPTSCLSSLHQGDLIRLDDVWYTIYSMSSTTLYLGTKDDYTVRSYYNNTDVTDLPLYLWSGGYEWDVTFIQPSTLSSLLSSPAHALNPSDAVMDIRTDDCDHCLYLEDLAVWTDYYVRGRYHNEYGYGGYGSTTSFTPKRIPGTPTDTSLSVVSSTELEVFFAPPSLPDNVDDIIKYTIQWDTTETFENATSSLASCSSGDFGACNVSGTAIVGTPPFSYLIEGLVPSMTYYVRIAARNSIAP